MKKIFLYLPLAVLLVSCIQKEPLNAEADIETCVVLNKEGKPDIHIKGRPIIGRDQIIIQANPHIDLTALALEVTLTKGASISPEPSKVLDYSKAQNFRVISEDGNWVKDYKVLVDTFDLPVKYNFEHWELAGNKKYHEFYESVETKDSVYKQYIWASGNSGYAITNIASSPEGFPTVAVPGRTGFGAKLETKSTGDLGTVVGMPIAAGNLFIGSFNVANATIKPLEATLFGLPFTKKPVSFSGYYKYIPGNHFKIKGDDGKPVELPGQKDSCDIYAVLYESEGESLNGKNILTSSKIIALARLENMQIASSDYIPFNIEFDYHGGKKIYWPPFTGEVIKEPIIYRQYDKIKAESYQYNLAVVFTSSKYGAYFAGAIGSVLYIDDVRIDCE